MSAAPSDIAVIPVYVDKKGTIYTGEKLLDIKTYQNLNRIEELALEVTLPPSPKTKPALCPVRKGLFNTIKPIEFDVIFPCFHGGVGEGGWIQGLAQYLDVPLASSGLTGAVIGMDKVLMKHTFGAAGLQQAVYTWFYRSEWESNKPKLLKELIKKHPFPIFVKPSRGGSSIGTTKAKNRGELERAIDLAASLDTRVIVETGIEGARELNCSVIGYPGGELKPSVVEEVIHDQDKDFLDFSEKYLSKEGKSQGMASTSRVVPARIPATLAQRIQAQSVEIFRLLDCGGVVRIDFLVKGKDIYVIEINTIPGSLSFYLWNKSGYPYSQLIKYLIDEAVHAHAQSSRITTFSSNILSHFEQGSGTKLGKK